MKICLVSQEYPPETPWGGIGTQTRNKACALAMLGHNVHVITRVLDLESPERIDLDDGVTVHRMKPPGQEGAIYGRCTYMLGYSWYVLNRLSKLHDEYQFEIVDFPEFGGEGFAYALDRNCWNWIPTVIHLHGSVAMFAEATAWPEPGSRFYEYGRFIEEFCLKRADGILASSGLHADLVCRHYNLNRSEIDVVYCGVDAEHFTPIPTPRPSRPTVLFVGNIVENKGIHIVVQAILKLRAAMPEILLCAIGKLPPESSIVDDMKAWIAAAKAERNVEWLGFVPPSDLPRHYREADVFCSPSDFEGGVANVYLEAMACECPVIASHAGGGAEAVIDGETGFLIAPNDVDAAADAMAKVLGNSVLREMMGKKSRHRVEENFALDVYIKRVVTAYEKAIAKSNANPLRHEDQRD